LGIHNIEVGGAGAVVAIGLGRATFYFTW